MVITNENGEWFYTFEMKTGSIDFRTGAHVPYKRDGVAWPETVVVKCGPYATEEAARLIA